ncbi:MAG: metal-sulfur cluster assembly factor [Oscillochloridaceae bacterium]|nr:metal-sulfur cluster assembly factor [Chloroflexaceae bacterium]MDW8391978.1 metal-sulfur cluster assembly factor [Oscillochloridaceae bacterium]
MTVFAHPAPDLSEVMEALGRCYDPCCREKEVSVVDMGLVERVCIAGSQVDVDLVLTTGWCPFSMHMLTMIEEEVGKLPGVEQVRVNFTWDVPWSPERLSESARAKLRLPLEKLLPLREARLARERASGQEGDQR